MAGMTPKGRRVLQRRLKALHKVACGSGSPPFLKQRAMCGAVLQKAGQEVPSGLSKDALLKLACSVGNVHPSPANPKLAKKRKVESGAPSSDMKRAFYGSWEWRTLRTKILERYGRRCMCCGAMPDHFDMSGVPVKIVVDHIKPLSKFWDLRLKAENLQVLCDECNQGKGAWSEADYRNGRHVESAVRRLDDAYRETLR